MKKVYRLEDLDCAVCAAKMEAAIAKLEGISAVSVNFITQKMTLEAEEARFDAVLREVLRVIRKVEPDCRVIL